jgi:hypothetical protein
MDKYQLTNDEKDKVQSSDLFNQFKNATGSKMTASKFKDDMLGMSGVVFSKMKNGNYFKGLKERVDVVEDLDE